MTEFKGTKGIWELDDKAVVVFEDGIKEYQEIAGCTYCSDIPEIEQLANAQLIASAPGLLHALQKCLDFLDNIEDDPNYGSMNDYHNARDFGKQAINKALGK